MNRTVAIRARVNPELKAEAEAILAKHSFTPSKAIAMFYRQIIEDHCIPFDMHRPNAATRRAMEDARNGKGLKTYTLDELQAEFS